jgi:hypothetical protein
MIPECGRCSRIPRRSARSPSVLVISAMIRPTRSSGCSSRPRCFKGADIGGTLLREAGVTTLGALRDKIFRSTQDPEQRARALEGQLSRAWRVSGKTAAMFFSAVTVPDLCVRSPPWQVGVDWTRFVVIDSNVDLFLAAIGYAGSSSYDARREFVRAISRRIDLTSFRSNVHAYNPRLVQQAMFTFMSATNRRTNPRDCMHVGTAACGRCPRALVKLCPVHDVSRGMPL